MLSYEDSKELERLGYPQELKEGDWYYRETRDGKPLSPEVPELQVICWSCAWDSAIYELYPPYYVKVPTTDGMIEGLHGLGVWGLKWQEYTPSPDDMIRNLTGHEASIVSGFTGKAPEEERLYYRQAISTSLEKALCELYKKIKSGENT